MSDLEQQSFGLSEDENALVHRIDDGDDDVIDEMECPDGDNGSDVNGDDVNGDNVSSELDQSDGDGDVNSEGSSDGNFDLGDEYRIWPSEKPPYFVYPWEIYERHHGSVIARRGGMNIRLASVHRPDLRGSARRGGMNLRLASVHRPDLPQSPPFRFLDLLPELRTVVYSFAIVDHNSFVPLELCPSRRIDINHEASLYMYSGSRHDITDRRKQPPLLAVCRLIRQEALHFYYSHNTFSIDQTVVRAGCMFPLYRYPTTESASGLRSLRALETKLRVMEEAIVNKSETRQSLLRVIVELKVIISIRHSRSRVRLRILDGRLVQEVGGRDLTKAVLERGDLTSVQKSFLMQMVRKQFGELKNGAWDGFDLLRAAATLPCQFNSPEGGLEWFSLMPKDVAMDPNSVVALGPHSRIGQSVVATRD